jgi:serine/threonine-protein kinase HipA
MSEQKGFVYYNDILAGVIIKKDGLYTFEYSDDYYKDPALPSISLTLPKKEKRFESDILFPFFFGMLAEGNNRKIQCRTLGIDDKDHFTRLIETAGYETIGAITVRKNESEISIGFYD